MSLRDLGVFAPTPEGHPAIGERCWICGVAIEVGVRVALRQFSSSCEKKDGSCVPARLICATCHLRGTEVETPIGRRIVDRVRADLYPVCMTDGTEWREDAVWGTIKTADH